MKRSIALLLLMLLGCSSQDNPVTPSTPTDNKVNVQISYYKPTSAVTVQTDIMHTRTETTSYATSCLIYNSNNEQLLATIPNTLDSTIVRIPGATELRAQYLQTIVSVIKNNDGTVQSTGTTATLIFAVFKVGYPSTVWNIR